MNATYLLMVTPEGNHNKFYRMLPNFPDDSHFTVEWGRVGATAIKKIYSMAAWDKIYKDKITKGYVFVPKKPELCRKWYKPKEHKPDFLR